MFPHPHLSDFSRPELQGAVLLAAGLLWLCLRFYRTAAAFFVVGALWIFACATPAFADLLRRGLEDPYPPHQAFEYPAADAIVVLGGGDPPDFGHDAEKEQTNRTGFALELYHETRAPIILLSGGVGEAGEMAQQLELQGVPANALRIEPNSSTTNQNAAYSALILKREHRHRILLVTSTVFMRRAAACFAHLGMDVIPAPTRDADQEPISSAPWWPQRAALFQSQLYLHEYMGMIAYKLHGWI
jgi:uncharacterized SAM-binding protein YcdF (DUF218 family)